jgi:5-methylcytosine-specific restriction endonuclease McrA
MAWARGTYSPRSRRLPSNWPALRKQVLARDGYRCCHVENNLRCTDAATDVDHIFHGDNHDPMNLQALCAYHHRIKSSREGHAARPKMRRPVEPHPGIC